MKHSFVLRITALAAWIVLTTGGAFAQVMFDWLEVGNAGNDPDSNNGYGQVLSTYRIATSEVNLFQYTQFLNAVDPSGQNPNVLYNPAMSSDVTIAGISFNAALPPGEKYAVLGAGLRPVTYVSWNDAARFVNWIHNGQGSGSTEDGVYNMSLSIPTRSTTASVFLPTENEWYKAAYYDPTPGAGGGDNYWLYPMKTDEIPYSDDPPGNDPPVTTRSGNFFLNDGVSSGYNSGYALSGSTVLPTPSALADGSGYPDSVSAYGTFGQGGNAAEWNETIISSGRGFRGGSWADPVSHLASSGRSSAVPTLESATLGFRIASIPEPSTWILLTLGGALLLGHWQFRRTT